MKVLRPRILSAIAFVVSPTMLYADPVTAIQVSAKYTEKGVRSSVELVLPDYDKRYLGRTDPGGSLTLKEPLDCKAGMVLSVKPVSSWYRNTRKDMVCTNPEIVVVTRRAFDYQLYLANGQPRFDGTIGDMSMMYMGVDVHADGGSWQEIDGRLAQTDASAWLAGAMVPAGIPRQGRLLL